MDIDKHYDVVIIGSGQAGGPLSTAFASSGKSTALIERKDVGGTCINVGCTPTKTLIASGRVAYLTRRASDFGVVTDSISIDMERLLQRKRDIVTMFREGSQKSIESQGVELIFGEASFLESKVIKVESVEGVSTIGADLVFINTGCRPAEPELEGLDEVPWFDSTSIMELDSVPDHLIVLGGGYIGLEFGQLYRRLGSQVTMVHRGERLLGREDSDISDAVGTIMKEDGIEIVFQSNAQRVEGREGAISLQLETRDGPRTIAGSHLLVAVGRVPNTEALHLDAAGVAVNDRHEIIVTDTLETNVPGIYALGDVHGGPQFTHMSYDDSRVVRTNLIDGGQASTRDRLVPYTVYIDPQLGRVGITEAEARKQGKEIRVASMPMTRVARALETDESRGLMKAVVDAKNHQILGCAVLGIEGGEVMSMIEIAMMGKLPWQALRNGIFAHPTLAEGFNNLFGSLE